MITLNLLKILYYLQSRFFNVTVINSLTERDAEVLIDSLCRIVVLFGDQQLYPWISCIFHYVVSTTRLYLLEILKK